MLLLIAVTYEVLVGSKLEFTNDLAEENNELSNEN